MKLSILIPITPERYETVQHRVCKVCKSSFPIEKFTHHYLNGKKYYEYKCKDCRSKSRRVPVTNAFILQEGEVLMQIFGLEGRYLISNFGRICSLRYSQNQKGSAEREIPTLIKTPLNGNGYPSICIRMSANYHKPFRIHKLVAQHFIPNPQGLPCINHKDGDKTNNRVENLEWCTFQHNLLHARRSGLNPVCWGEDRKKSSLKNSDVIEILNSTETIKELSLKYKVGITAIWDIKNGKSWNHITKLPLTRKKK